MKNKWQIEYCNIHQRPTKMVDAYAAKFKKAISKVKIVNLLLAQMQIMDFIVELRTDLAIITNGLNLADLNKIKKMAKNIESVSLINKNIMTAVTSPAVVEIKELKA